MVALEANLPLDLSQYELSTMNDEPLAVGFLPITSCVQPIVTDTQSMYCVNLNTLDGLAAMATASYSGEEVLQEEKEAKDERFSGKALEELSITRRSKRPV